MRRSDADAAAVSAAALSSTPFGEPVEPDVAITTAVSAATPGGSRYNRCAEAGAGLVPFMVRIAAGAEDPPAPGVFAGGARRGGGAGRAGRAARRASPTAPRATRPRPRRPPPPPRAAPRTHPD